MGMGIMYWNAPPEPARNPVLPRKCLPKILGKNMSFCHKKAAVP